MGKYELNKNLAQMLKGGVIMDVTNAEQAKIAEAAGACAVMALERVPADIRRDGGVARMSDPQMIKAIQNHVDKTAFKVPFVCGARNLGEALRRIGEGAAMIRTKGEAGTGNVVEAVTHMRQINDDMRRVKNAGMEELMSLAKEFGAPYELVKYVHENGKLPVVNFAAGGIATPADAALMMQLGSEGVFVGSGIFKSGDPAKRARAIVQAVTYYNDPVKLAELSENLGEAMSGLEIKTLENKYAERGW